MSPPFPPVRRHVQLGLSRPVADRLESADDATYERFVRAKEFAEIALGLFHAAVSSGSSRALPVFAGILLDVRFDPRSERFYISDFFDWGADPPPTPGIGLAAPKWQALYQLLVCAGLDVDAVWSLLSNKTSIEIDSTYDLFNQKNHHLYCIDPQQKALLLADELPFDTCNNRDHGQSCEEFMLAAANRKAVIQCDLPHHATAPDSVRDARPVYIFGSLGYDSFLSRN